MNVRRQNHRGALRCAATGMRKRSRNTDLPLRIHFLLLSLISILSIYHTAFAQSGRKPQGQQGQQGQNPTEKPIARIETREVVLPLIAYDANGEYVDNLTEKDVLVLEEGESRPVTKLRREPANIILILDLSNEIGTFKNGPTERVEREQPVWEKGKDYQVLARQTAREFANHFVSHLSPNDQIAIIQYADKVQLIQDWTNDRNKALEALQSKYRVGIKSSYYDALKLAAEKLQSQQRGRRVVVLVSDG